MTKGLDILPQLLKDSTSAKISNVFFILITLLLLCFRIVCMLLLNWTELNKKMKLFYKIFALLLLLCLAFNVKAESGANIYEISRDLPSRFVYSETGKQVKLSDFKGDFVIAVFWSRYCVPCLSEMNNLRKFAAVVKNDGIRVIMISPKKEWKGGFEEQKFFLTRFDAQNMETYVDHNGDLAASLGIYSTPVTVLISRQAKEIGRIRGTVNWMKEGVISYFYTLKAKN